MVNVNEEIQCLSHLITLKIISITENGHCIYVDNFDIFRLLCIKYGVDYE